MARYEVVISGISGAFPGKLDVDGLEERMFNSHDDGTIITLDPKNFFKDGHSDKAEFLGHVDAQLDSNSFGINGLILPALNASLKAVLEKTYEAIVDAGIPPTSLRGQNIASIGAVFNSDSEMQTVDPESNKYVVLTISRGMLANRVSYVFNFTGMSYTIDCCWLGGLAALDAGARLVATGMAKAALVMSTSIILRPEVTEQLGQDGLAFTSPDGKTRSFCHDADGFTNSEAVVAMFLQRKEDALRSYGKIEMSHVSTTMVRQMSSIIGTDYKTFLHECYSNITFDPEDIAYLEADGIAIPDKDREELEAVIESIVSRRKSRLPVSCCKNRLGHSGGTAGLVSVVHSLLASRQGYIPPNLHYVPPSSQDHPANHPKIEIVSEKKPLIGNLMAVNSFGFTDISGHIVLRRNEKERSAQDILSERDPPFLIHISGRNKEDMINVLKKLSRTCNDRGYIALAHKAYRISNPTHTIRGFSILNSPVPTTPVVEASDFGGKLSPVWLVFSGMGSQWNQMGKDLLRLPFLAASLQQSHDTLLSKGLDLLSVLTSEDPDVFEDITNAFVSITAIQVALVDLLNRLGIKADGIIGHSVGEVACGYADGCLTAEQAILCAYARGRASKETALIKGMMAAVGRGYAEIEEDLPDGIEVACHNSSTSCTISGPSELVQEYVTELNNRGVFAKAVNVANIAYHSKYISPAGPVLLKYMREIILEPKERSSRWVCSSVEESRWEEAALCSAEYYTNNLLNTVLFEEAAHRIPEGALLIEVAPHGLLQAILKRAHPSCWHVPLTSRTSTDNLVHLLEAVGRMFIHGLDMDLSNIFPAVSFPVPRETKSLCGLSTWSHGEDSKSHIFMMPINSSKNIEEFIHIRSQEVATLSENYFVQDKSVFPTSFILGKVRDVIQQHKLLAEKDFVQFEEVRIYSLLEISRIDFIKVYISVLEIGEFLVFDEQRTLVISGRYSQYYGENADNLIKEGKETLRNLILIEQDQVYDLLEKAEYQIRGPFRSIKSVQLCPEGFISEIDLNNDCKYLIESVILSALFFQYFKCGQVCHLESIQHMIMQNVTSFKSVTKNRESVSVHYSVASGALSCDGLFISNMKFTETSSLDTQISVRKTTFFPCRSTRQMSTSEFVDVLIQVLQQASNGAKQITVIKLEEIDVDPVNVFNMISRYSQTEVELKTMSLLELRRLGEYRERDAFMYVIPYIGNEIPDVIHSVCELNANCYVLAIMEKSCSKDCFNGFSCLMEVQLDDCSALLLNKPRKTSAKNVKIHSNIDSNFLDCTDDRVLPTETPNYIVSNLLSYSKLMELWGRKNRAHQTGDVRFVFLDESSPTFDCESAFYKEQLQMGLKINVCKRSQWGYMIKVPTHLDATLNNNHVLTSVLSNKATVHSVSTIHIDEDDTSAQVVDYQGLIHDKRVMGVASLENNELLEDPVLQWECPSTWSSQQACTIPVAYSLAYYIALLSSRMLSKLKSMLIVEPEGPCGDAVIRVFSFLGVKITLVYASQHQKQNILRRFPQLNEKDILVCERNKLLMELENGTNKNGYALIVNFSKESQYLSILSKCLKDNNSEGSGGCCQFIQISKRPLETNYKLGLEMLSRGISLMSCFPTTLVSLKEDEKVELRAAVEKGLKEGVVEPLQYKKLCFPVTYQRLQQAKQTCKEEGDNLIVNSNPKTETIVKKSRKISQLLIGKGELCYSLLHYLESLSNKNIHVLFDGKSSSPSFEKRYNTLRRKRSRKMTHFHAHLNLESIKSSQSWIANIQEDHQIESAFILTEGLEGTALEAVQRGVMKELERGCRVFLVGEDVSGAGDTCVKLVTQNQSTASIVSALAKLYRNQVSEGEYHLGQTMNQCLADRYGPASCMPDDIHELLEIGYSLTSGPAHFTQIATRSTPVVNSSRYSPLFVIPGFRVAKLKAMIPRLYSAAYIARLPSTVTDIDSLAMQLKKQLTENFRQDIYSFVCEGWSQVLTMKLAKLLEGEGKQCQIFMLDAELKQILNYLKDITLSKLILDYLPVSDKVLRKISNGKNIEEKIAFSLQDCGLNDTDSSSLKSSLRNIIDMSSLVSKVELKTVRNNAFVNCFKAIGNRATNQAPEIEEICMRPVWLSCVEQKDTFSCDQLPYIISDRIIQEIPGQVKKQNLERQRSIAYAGREIKKLRSLV